MPQGPAPRGAPQLLNAPLKKGGKKGRKRKEKKKEKEREKERKEEKKEARRKKERKKEKKTERKKERHKERKKDIKKENLFCLLEVLDQFRGNSFVNIKSTYFTKDFLVIKFYRNSLNITMEINCKMNWGKI